MGMMYLLCLAAIVLAELHGVAAVGRGLRSSAQGQAGFLAEVEQQEEEVEAPEASAAVAATPELALQQFRQQSPWQMPAATTELAGLGSSNTDGMQPDMKAQPRPAAKEVNVDNAAVEDIQGRTDVVAAATAFVPNSPVPSIPLPAAPPVPVAVATTPVDAQAPVTVGRSNAAAAATKTASMSEPKRKAALLTKASKMWKPQTHKEAYQNCEPPCIHGRGQCNDNVCFCKSPYSGTTCQHEIKNQGVAYSMAVSFYVGSLFMGCCMAKVLHWLWFSAKLTGGAWQNVHIKQEVWQPPTKKGPSQKGQQQPAAEEQHGEDHS